MRLKDHLITANVTGLGLGGSGRSGRGLEEINRTDVVDISNERSWCIDKGYVKRLGVPSKKKYPWLSSVFVSNGPKMVPQVKYFRKF